MQYVICNMQHEILKRQPTIEPTNSLLYELRLSTHTNTLHEFIYDSADILRNTAFSCIIKVIAASTADKGTHTQTCMRTDT